MKKNCFLKGLAFFACALSISFGVKTPAFGEDLSRFEKTSYENKYGKDGRVETVTSGGYAEGYKLTNEFALESNVVVYLVTQDLFYIDDSSFSYEFAGTMDASSEFCDIGFLFDFELLENKSVSSSPELGCGEVVNVRNYQFSAYPGFYNFYNGGMNDFWTNSNGEVVIMKTLTPECNLSQSEGYVSGKDAWVEVTPGSSSRVYVLLGTKEWHEKVEKDVGKWAKEVEVSIYNSKIEGSDSVDVEVTMDEDSMEEALVDKEVVVETETQESPSFEESQVKEQKPREDKGEFAKYVGILVLAIVAGIGARFLYKAITKPVY